MRKQTWLAIVICAVAIVPAFFAGAVVSTICRVIITSQIGRDPDIFFLRALLGIEIPGLVSQWLITVGLPALVQGIVAGWLAALLTNAVCPEANIETAAYSTGALYTGITVLAMVLGRMATGPGTIDFLAVVQLIGAWTGLVLTARSRASARARLNPQQGGM